MWADATWVFRVWRRSTSEASPYHHLNDKPPWVVTWAPGGRRLCVAGVPACHSPAGEEATACRDVPLPLLLPLPHLHLLHSAFLFRTSSNTISCQVTFSPFQSHWHPLPKVSQTSREGNLLRVSFNVCHGPSVISKQWPSILCFCNYETTLQFPKHSLDVFFGESIRAVLTRTATSSCTHWPGGHRKNGSWNPASTLFASRVPCPEAARSKGQSSLTCIRVRCGLTDVLTSTPSALDWTALVVKKLLYTVKNTRENKTPKGLLLASSLHTHSYSLAGIPGWRLFLHLYYKSNISIRSSTHCESSRGSRKARTLTPLV